MGYSPWGPKESNTTEQLILEGVIFELRPKEGFKKSSDGWVEGFLGRIESKSLLVTQSQRGLQNGKELGMVEK